MHTVRCVVAKKLTRIRFPPGRHFAVTWGISDEFGGMTAAMLRRSRAFLRLAQTPVSILTFDTRPDYPELEMRLRARGELADGIALVNLYDWLRSQPDPVLPGGSLRLDRDAFTPLSEQDADARLERAGAVVARLRHADNGALLQIDHLREDGSLVLSDRRDTRRRGEPSGRALVLCDRDGVPTRSWNRPRWLYYAWLDRLTQGDPSWMIVDSKTSANFMVDYRRRHTATIHVVHNSHLARPDDPLAGVRESRREVFERIDGFDAVVVLTQRQLADIVAWRGPTPGLAVVPNPHALPPWPIPKTRDPRRGIVLATLDRRKRVEHALRAVLACRAHGKEVVLDVYGEGSERERLAMIAAEGEGIRLHGYDPAARDQLASCSFLLLTSSSEGFPLVLVEAMAVGCVPIAYDIRYGPRDIIVDGENGFLVPLGDVAALASAIERLLDLPPERLDSMRRAARRTAESYSELAVTRQWARLLYSVERRRDRASLPRGGRAGARAVRQILRRLQRAGD